MKLESYQSKLDYVSFPSACHAQLIDPTIRLIVICYSMSWHSKDWVANASIGSVNFPSQVGDMDDVMGLGSCFGCWVCIG